MTYHYKPFPYARAPGLDGPEPRHQVAIVGAGPVGLTAALDLARFGVATVVLDDNDVVSVGSRAICWSKRSLEILDRLGLGAPCVEKGVTWKVGRTFHGADEVYSFDLQPEPGHKMPAFVNLQQYYVEQYLVEAAMASNLIDLRFKNRVRGVDVAEDHVAVTVETPDGIYRLEADWLIACDGARSPVRGMLGLDLAGELFEERFLITDIEMKADFPPERWFWFAPPFHEGQSALLHKQPDDIWRIDLQLGPEADPEVERQPDRVIPRIEKVVGHADFRIDWVSVYTFQCARLARFVEGRVIFAGDSAHVVSPFGARGCNGGLQDVDALGWRLAAVVEGRAPASVLADYDAERQFGADENISNSARTTRFMTPDAGFERVLRDAALDLAGKAPFARALVNSGRLSRPCIYPLDAPDDPALPPCARPGAVAPDAPLPSGGWLIERLGHGPMVVTVGQPAPEIAGLERLELEPTPEVRQRYLGQAPWAIYLIRPDQVVAARWSRATDAEIARARDRMWGKG